VPQQIASRLEGVDVPWYVAAGWAIDLFLGGDHREHEDLEIAVPNARIDEVGAVFPELEFCVITGPEEATPLTEARDRVADTHQTWVRERARPRTSTTVRSRPTACSRMRRSSGQAGAEARLSRLSRKTAHGQSRCGHEPAQAQLSDSSHSSLLSLGSICVCDARATSSERG
jgi:hypothetical protein